jgi:hypothetical protein
MKGKLTYYIDQEGDWYKATSIKQLKQKYDLKGKHLPLYEEDDDGHTYQVGYVIGDCWLTAFTPVRIKVS